MLGYASDIRLIAGGRVVADVIVKNAEVLDLPFARALADDGAADNEGRRHFSLVASQEVGFLFGPVRRGAEAPVWEVPMAKILRPFMARLPSGTWMGHETLKLLLFNWIGLLTRDGGGERVRGGDSEAYAALVESGFLDALRERGAYVSMDGRP